MKASRLIPSFSIALAAACAPLFTASQAFSQVVDIAKKQSDGVSKMRAGDWAGALAEFKSVIDALDANAPTTYGPKFGYFWYHQGYCQLRLKQYSDAATSFETSYTKYANTPNVGADKRNIYQMTSLLKWGDALRGAKNYDEALKKYEKFLAERDKEKDKFNPGELNLSLAACHFQKSKPNYSEGIEKFKIALDNKVAYRVPNHDIMIVFNEFCKSLISSNLPINERERVFADFMKSHRDDVCFDDYLRLPYAQLIQQLALESINAQLHGMGAHLLGLIPDTDRAIDQITYKLQSMSTVARVVDGRDQLIRANLTQTLNKLKTDKRDGKLLDSTAIAASAMQSSMLGNYRASYGGYLTIEESYKKDANREQYLYQLVQLAAVNQEILQAEKYGTVFLKDFPNSKYVPAIQNLMLDSLFHSGKYELSLEVAERLISTLAEKTEAHDNCLHVSGGSNYYLGNYEKAQPDLEKHFNLYVKDAKTPSKNAVASTYFRAANPSRLQEFSKAEPLLQEFVDKYKNPSENPFLPFALFDLANCKYNLEKYADALVILKRISSEFPTTTNLQQVYVLQGNVHEALKEKAEAEKSYKKGLETAQTRNDDFTASEAILRLISLLDEDDRLKDAVTYYDEFFKKYPNSVFKAQAAVAGIKAMTSVNRLDDALKNLQTIIISLAKNPEDASELEKALTSYTDAYLTKFSVAQLVEHYSNFPGVRYQDTTLRALLAVSSIGAWESEIVNVTKAKQEDRINAAKANVTVLFNKLKVDFKPEDMTNYVALNLGNYLRRSSNPNEAIIYFERVLSNPNDKSYRNEAIVGKADVWGRSANKADNDKALAILQELLKDPTLDGAAKNEARYRVIKTLIQKEDWSAAQAATKDYLDQTPKITLNRQEVTYLHALSYDKAGKIEEALAIYGNLMGSFRSYITYSAPAQVRIMELLWERNTSAEKSKNQVSDRQVAYSSGAKFVKDFEPHLSKFSESDRSNYNKIRDLVEKYQSSGDVKTLEQLAKEAAEKKR